MPVTIEATHGEQLARAIMSVVGFAATEDDSNPPHYELVRFAFRADEVTVSACTYYACASARIDVVELPGAVPSVFVRPMHAEGIASVATEAGKSPVTVTLDELGVVSARSSDLYLEVPPVQLVRTFEVYPNIDQQLDEFFAQSGTGEPVLLSARLLRLITDVYADFDADFDADNPITIRTTGAASPVLCTMPGWRAAIMPQRPGGISQRAVTEP